MNVYNLYDFASETLFSVPCVLISLCYLPQLKKFFKNIKLENNFSFLSDIFFKDSSFLIKKIFAIVLHLFFVFILLFNSTYFVVNILGCEDIRAMPKGEYCYYVKATNEKGKTYTLPAKIIKTTDEYSDYVGDEERIRRKTVYCVENVYFENGGYLYFESYETFNFHEVQTYYDQDEREWEIKLTNKKAHHIKVKEVEIRCEIIDYICYFFIIVNTAVIYAHCYSLYKQNIIKKVCACLANKTTPDLSFMNSKDQQKYRISENKYKELESQLKLAKDSLKIIDFGWLLDLFKDKIIPKEEIIRVSENISKCRSQVKMIPEQMKSEKELQKSILLEYGIEI